MNLAGLMTFAWRWLGAVPRPIAEAGFDLAADLSWLRHGRKVRRLEANLSKVRPEADAREIRRLSRAGMRAYMRYYREVFGQSRMTRERIDARVRTIDDHLIRPYLEAGGPVVLALGHMGNFDLAGAWASKALAPVLTVAERLEPPELFEDFRRVREAAGVQIVPLGDSGSAVFRELVRRAGAAQQSGEPMIVPILADRDLSSAGVEVDWFSRRARLAPGPAALAQRLGVPLVPASMWHELLPRDRRRAAGSRWGLVVRFHPRVEPPAGLSRTAQVRAMTQDWGTALAGAIAEHPQDWHMLQKVFVEDLDPDRDAARRQVADGGSRVSAPGGVSDGAGPDPDRDAARREVAATVSAPGVASGTDGTPASDGAGPDLDRDAARRGGADDAARRVEAREGEAP